MTDLNLTETLKRLFGFDKFKGDQEAIIRNLLSGNDTFVLMPTGGGKSLCYQLPSLVMEGTAIVISPLIALMKNQIDVINGMCESTGVAHCLNSSMNKSAIDEVKDDVLSGKTKLLYMAPESLIKEEYVNFLRQVKISFYAIDEAHCISEWGHDFRPEYRNIRSTIDKVGRAPVIALTATATDKVRMDIKRSLGIPDANEFKSSFNRPNLYYEVRPKTNQIDKDIIKFIRKNAGKSGIIYCLSRKKVEELAAVLCTNEIKAAPYHAGLDTAERNKTQDAFLMENIDVIVATIAFGMGIDKPDVRFVIHYDIPKSLEGYYQETGRAGRDGGEGKCIAYYSHKDLQKLEKFMADKQGSEQDIGRHQLQETEAYAESSLCRRKLLLNYFGETYTQENCCNCDNCLHPKKKVEASEELKCILESVAAIKENFLTQYVINFVKGRATDDITSHKHHLLEEFGCGEDMNDKLWNPVIRYAMVEGLLRKEVEDYGTLKLTAAGRRWLKDPQPFYITEDNDFTEEESEDSSDARGVALDPELYSILKNLRKSVAAKKKLPPYVIFQDISLEQMATMYPQNLQELQNIQGVGQGKANKFGKEFCEVIKKYCEENEIVRPEDLRVRTLPKTSQQKKIKIITSIDKKMPLEDIAKSLQLEFDEFLTDMEKIVDSGTRLNIGYDLLENYDEDDINYIYDYFRKAQTDNISEAVKVLGEEFDGDIEDFIRLVRIKFLSEVAN